MVYKLIRVDEEAKKFLENERLIPRETFNSVVKRLIAKVKILKSKEGR